MGNLKANFAGQCAMLCAEPMFRVFLKAELVLQNEDIGEPWCALRTKEHAAIAVRHLLELDSRRELNEDPEKAKAWQAMAQRFNDWQNYG